MKNSILIAAVVILVLFLAGCQTSTTSSSSTPFIGGTNGLLISFLDNSPPPQVSDGATFPFNIIVLLENAGEYDIPAGQASVTISGLYPGDFGVSSAQLTATSIEAISGAKKDPAGNTIQGGTIQIQIPPTPYQLNFQRVLTTGNLVLPIQTNVCYAYSTRASGRYCLRSNPSSTAQGVCEPSGSKEIFSSASPIQVDSLVESYAGSGAVNLNFRISKKGNGNVFRPNSPSTPVCGQTTATNLLTNQNVVGVTVDVPGAGAGSVTCYGLGTTAINTGFVRLDNQGNAVVSCKIAAPVPPVDAVREISIVLNFDYSEVRTSSLLVQKTTIG
ncbi:MAG: hypothetical protein V1702_02675 [Candidatus Woesearchaeota archaeon]